MDDWPTEVKVAVASALASAGTGVITYLGTRKKLKVVDENKIRTFIHDSFETLFGAQQKQIQMLQESHRECEDRCKRLEEKLDAKV